MKVFNAPVPANKIRQFHEILCATGGRYIDDPRLSHDGYRVSYEPGDYLEMQRAWNMVTQPVVEVRRDQSWRKFVRRIFGFMKARGMGNG